jgi:hypothetical protein
MDRKSLREAFRVQKRSAIKVRGISWELTFDEWIKVWIDSGHLHERGRKRGQYVMARFRDQGPYSASNVKIVTCSQNNSEQKPVWLGKALSEEHKKKLQKANLGHTNSPEARSKLSKALQGNKNALGGPGHNFAHSEEARAKMRATWAIRKARHAG